MRLVLIADNIRSIENTGALFRLADGVGASEIVLVGITPYPDLGEADTRRPWLKHRTTERLKKTALSGFDVPFRYFETQAEALAYVRGKNSVVVTVEQTDSSIPLSEMAAWMDSRTRSSTESIRGNDSVEHVAMVVGHEVDGVSKEFVEGADVCVEIPMYGKGKSLNVAVAAGIVAYNLKR